MTDRSAVTREKERDGKREGEKGFRPVCKPKSAREHRAVLTARTQLPGGECRGTLFYILIVEIAGSVCRVTLRGPPRLGRPGEPGARGSRRIVVGKWKGLGRGVDRAKARGHEYHVWPIEEDRPIGFAGQRGTWGRGSLEMIDTRTG